MSEIRLLSAAARLANRLPGEKIASVAFDCGFDSLTTFNRAFKARFGVPPREFEAVSQARTDVQPDSP
ncbi:helix-turn-helix domain-containing protein [Inquilinus limosus]|uniref:helix-turn-helix domain-containing protein n=1 Tax=Inquilinus limosus TaxID=171674 RepID=UPI003F189457